MSSWWTRRSTSLSVPSTPVSSGPSPPQDLFSRQLSNPYDGKAKTKKSLGNIIRQSHQHSCASVASYDLLRDHECQFSFLCPIQCKEYLIISILEESPRLPFVSNFFVLM